MKLLPNENELITTKGNQVVLTNYRIVRKDNEYRIDIFLENISSIETQYKSNPILLLLSVIALIGGLAIGANGDSEAIIIGVVLAGIFAGIWWFTRKHIITVKPDGGNPLNIVIESMSKDKVENFINNIQDAKLNRVNNLYTKGL